MSDVEIERRAHPRARLGFVDDMVVERGSKADWELLEHLHYKAEGLPAAPRFWRLALDGDTVGVIVTASPKPLLKERHVLFPKLKPDGDETKITNVHRFKLLNDHFRVIARMVVDTLYRGTGASYRFQNLASRMEGARFVEIQSSMSKFNPFALKAGFRFAPVANSNKFDQGLRFFRQTFAAAPADHEAIVAEIEAMSPRLRERTLEDVRTFYYRHSALEKTGSNRGKGRGRVDEMTPAELVKNLQQMVLASPAYGVFKNPDAGRALPAQLPIRAFATQGLSDALDDAWMRPGDAPCATDDTSSGRP
ncbi:hypothetical protein [Inquilinus sp. OTU3971]|uniref:hypothetical protein n=1 Tax=Inquilinus sp. OTU3971 TaxID=3043855 RepID=UPI00313E7B71